MAVNTPGRGKSIQQTSTPVFGRPEQRILAPFNGKGEFPTGYQWMRERNTLLICRNHLVLVRGGEERSAILDKLENAGLLGGVLIGVPRLIRERSITKRSELPPETATQMFDDKLLVWCKKEDAVIWRYHESRLVLKSSSEQLYCKFSSRDGVMHACAILWVTALKQYPAQDKTDIKAFGCRILDVAQDVPVKKVLDEMAASRARLPS